MSRNAVINPRTVMRPVKDKGTGQDPPCFA